MRDIRQGDIVRLSREFRRRIGDTSKPSVGKVIRVARDHLFPSHPALVTWIDLRDGRELKSLDVNLERA